MVLARYCLGHFGWHGIEIPISPDISSKRSKIYVFIESSNPGYVHLREFYTNV